MNISVNKFSLLIITGLLATTSIAQSSGHRPDTRYMNCGAAISLIQGKGAAILRTGAHTYDKYVANHAYCARDEALKRAYVPTADNRRCNVGYRCVEKNFR
jgi:hypothetical protein